MIFDLVYINEVDEYNVCIWSRPLFKSTHGWMKLLEIDKNYILLPMTFLNNLLIVLSKTMGW